MSQVHWLCLFPPQGRAALSLLHCCPVSSGPPAIPYKITIILKYKPKTSPLCVNSSMHSEYSADSLLGVDDKVMFPCLSHSALLASLFPEHSHVCSRLWVCTDSSLCLWRPPISFCGWFPLILDISMQMLPLRGSSLTILSKLVSHLFLSLGHTTVVYFLQTM